MPGLSPYPSTMTSVESDSSIKVTNISLRQKVGEELEFVTLIEQSDSTDVIVDGQDLEPGISHSLILESFDSNGSTTTLRTDTITITVGNADRDPALQSTLEVKALGSVTLAVANIAASADKNINLRQRQNDKLSFVTFFEKTGETDV